MALAAAELERMGPPAPSDEQVMGDEYAPSPTEALQEALPGLLGADELRDENDILFIANEALLRGIRDPADMVKFLARMEMLAQMSKMWVSDSKYQRPPPRVQQIARYLRFVKENEKRFPRA